jgi:hypothetical protein
MRVESGPARADRNWFLLVLGICILFSAWFLYDGAIGYVKNNRKEARRQLTPLVGEQNIPAVLGERPTKPDFDRVVEQRITEPARVREALLGDPDAAPFHVTHENARRIEYYVSDYGQAIVPIAGNRVLAGEMTWTKWDKTREAVRGQFAWALIPILFGLYVAYRVYKAVTLRVVVDDGGVTYAGQRIPLEQITAVKDYNRKGWVDMYYRRGAQQRRLRLDDHKIERFADIVTAICGAKGYQNPLPTAQTDAAEPSAAHEDSDDDELERVDS